MRLPVIVFTPPLISNASSLLVLIRFCENVLPVLLALIRTPSSFGNVESG